VGGVYSCLAYLPPVCIRVEAAVANHDLTLVRNVWGHAGDTTSVVILDTISSEEAQKIKECLNIDL
jgi:hypothetical protein